MFPELSPHKWLLAGIAALGIGVSKSGLPGLSLLHVVFFAQLFPGIASTGVLLPMLIAGDVGAVLLFRRQAAWRHVARMLPPAFAGVVLGWWLMGRLREVNFSPVIGGIVLVLALVQLLRHWRPALFAEVPHTCGFAWTMGLAAGVTTMLANAAGPVMALYLLAVALPKAAFVGTSAWFFLLINLAKVPLSAQLGLITADTLAFNAVLVPVIASGLILGRAVMVWLPQKWFDLLVLAFALVAAARLLGGEFALPPQRSGAGSRCRSLSSVSRRHSTPSTVSRRRGPASACPARGGSPAGRAEHAAGGDEDETDGAGLAGGAAGDNSGAKNEDGRWRDTRRPQHVGHHALAQHGCGATSRMVIMQHAHHARGLANPKRSGDYTVRTATLTAKNSASAVRST